MKYFMLNLNNNKIIKYYKIYYFLKKYIVAIQILYNKPWIFIEENFINKNIIINKFFNKQIFITIKNKYLKMLYIISILSIYIPLIIIIISFVYEVLIKEYIYNTFYLLIILFIYRIFNLIINRLINNQQKIIKNIYKELILKDQMPLFINDLSEYEVYSYKVEDILYKIDYETSIIEVYDIKNLNIDVQQINKELIIYCKLKDIKKKINKNLLIKNMIRVCVIIIVIIILIIKNLYVY